MIHIGVVGCGKIAEKHLAAYKKLDGARTTVTDIVPKGESVAKRYGATWNPDPSQLIQSSSVDAIDVCIPTPSHAQVIVDALECGHHVFCEKPLASNLAEAVRISEVAAKTDAIVMVGFLYRFHPAFQFAKEVLSEGVIGEPYFALLRLGGRGSHKAWKHKRETGGGATNEMLVHMADLALWYFGAPRRTRMILKDTLLRDREIEGISVEAEAEDLCLLEMEMEAGVRTLCQSDLVTPSYMNYMEVQGTNGSLFTSILDFFPSIVYCQEPVGTYDRGHNFLRFPKVDLFERELGYFLECIERGSEPSVNSLKESVGLMRLLESIEGNGVGR